MVAAAALALSVLTQRHECLVPFAPVSWADSVLDPQFALATMNNREIRTANYLYYDRWFRLEGHFQWIDASENLPRPPQDWQVPPRYALTQNLMNHNYTPTCLAPWSASDASECLKAEIGAESLHSSALQSSAFFERKDTAICPKPRQIMKEPILLTEHPPGREHDFTLPPPWLKITTNGWSVEWYGRDITGRKTITKLPVVSSIAATVKQINSLGTVLYSHYGQVSSPSIIATLQKELDQFRLIKQQKQTHPPTTYADRWPLLLKALNGWGQLLCLVLAIYLSYRWRTMRIRSRWFNCGGKMGRGSFRPLTVAWMIWNKVSRIISGMRTSTSRPRDVSRGRNSQLLVRRAEAEREMPDLSAEPLIGRNTADCSVTTADRSVGTADLAADIERKLEVLKVREARIVARERELARSREEVASERSHLAVERRELDAASIKANEISRKAIDTSERATALFESARRQLEIADTKEQLAAKSERILQTRLKLLDGREAMLESRQKDFEKQVASAKDILVMAEVQMKRVREEEQSLSSRQTIVAEASDRIERAQTELNTRSFEQEARHRSQTREMLNAQIDLERRETELRAAANALETERSELSVKRRELDEAAEKQSASERELSTRESVLEAREREVSAWRRRVEALATDVAGKERELEARAREMQLKSRELELKERELSVLAKEQAQGTSSGFQQYFATRSAASKMPKYKWNELNPKNKGYDTCDAGGAAAGNESASTAKSLSRTSTPPGPPPPPPPPPRPPPPPPPPPPPTSSASNCDRALDLAFGVMRLPPGFETSWPE